MPDSCISIYYIPLVFNQRSMLVVTMSIVVPISVYTSVYPATDNKVWLIVNISQSSPWVDILPRNPSKGCPPFFSQNPLKICKISPKNWNFPPKFLNLPRILGKYPLFFPSYPPKFFFRIYTLTLS